ncbi:SDR family NAD(P)-dependent oxidoreductase [Lactobacillus sp. ESL0731]|uniref:SDR family NAD(P)-dependent oxidoreductase n=1 Tax=unclassified Lactobacillus TaxID=2620435 RepID=UPI0023F9CC0F|nr:MULTISPECIES: SDR family NAD(P)-dependent oxidoreductase [unclassified Lactobacillus]WEV50388.1 SDR family NAD(P)-dependent oxidoreductase [Lactobacillus sp. ESL0700]WEV61518.1 SDR family NAD(P)-dependent oxidoreductase [Lactobacillus sp. ESL0731]
MKEFKDKVALITGAAHGFGRSLALEAADRGMQLAIADIDEPALAKTLQDVKSKGIDAISIPTDVTEESAVDNMVKQTMAEYGEINLLINSAGIAIPGPIWELPTRDWEWILHADLMSQVWSLKRVIPIMRKQEGHCDIINVASMAGLTTSPLMPAYYATKFAVVGMTEAVEYDLQVEKANVGMHVFCPAFVQTDLYHTENHRPAKYTDESDPYYSSKTFKDAQAQAKKDITTGMPIDNVPKIIFRALEEDKFYILTHPGMNAAIVARAENIPSGKGPDLQALMPFLKETHDVEKED